MKHLGLYIFNGLAPSPQLYMKFRPTKYNPVNGNDFVIEDFGNNGKLRNQDFNKKNLDQ